MSLTYKFSTNWQQDQSQTTFPEKVFSSLKSASCTSKILTGPEPQFKKDYPNFADESATEVELFINQSFL